MGKFTVWLGIGNLQGYHILAMALFTPALLLEPQLLSMSLAIAAALLVVAEVLRVGKVPLLGPKIHRFMTSFIDSRDAGPLLVSHFSLLAGGHLSTSHSSFSWLLNQRLQFSVRAAVATICKSSSTFSSPNHAILS